MASKFELRRSIRSALTGLSRSERSKLDRRIAGHVASTQTWRDASVVLVYRSMADEVDTASLVELALGAGKLVGFPRISGSEMRFHRFDGDASLLSRHRYGMEEPQDSAAAIDPADLRTGGERVLALVPGLSFDGAGNRLGRGKGFYDRFLAAHRGDLISAGLCYELQLRETLPVEAHDSRVDFVITENGVFPSPTYPQASGHRP